MPGRGRSSIGKNLTYCLGETVLLDGPNAGLLRVQGRDSLDLLHRLSTNDLLNMKRGEVRPTVFATDKGRIVDFVQVLCDGDALLLLGCARTPSLLRDWFDKYTFMEDIRTEDITPSFKTALIVGSQAASIVLNRLGINVTAGNFLRTASRDDELLVAGVRGPYSEYLQLLMPAGVGDDVPRELLEAGIHIADSSTAEAVRICQGLPEAGAELTEFWNPYEVGLGYAINFKKGCYVGQEVIARLDTYQKVRKRLLGVVLNPSPPPTASSFPLEGARGIIGTVTRWVAVGERGLGLAVVEGTLEPPARIRVVGPEATSLTASLLRLPMTADDLRQEGVA